MILQSDVLSDSALLIQYRAFSITKIDESRENWIQREIESIRHGEGEGEKER